MNKRNLEDLFDDRLKDLYEGRLKIKSNDILLGYIAVILFEYRYGRETRQVFKKLIALRGEDYIDFSPSLKSTISIYLSNGAQPWAEFVTQGHLGDGASKVGRPPGIFRLKEEARDTILSWKKDKPKLFETFLAAHAHVKKEVV